MIASLDRAVDATPSELQTDYRRLLDLAETTPVDIKQRGKKPTIAMVNKETWRDAVIAKAWLSILSAVVKYATGRLLDDPKPVCPSEFAWLRLYGTDDIRTFIDELSGTILSVVNGAGNWDHVHAVVDEWCRSAALLENKNLVERFKQASEEIRD